MAGLRLVSLFIILLLSSFICTPGICGAWATTTTTTAADDEDNLAYLTDGKVSISEDFYGLNVQYGGALDATDYYYIYTRFSNPSNETNPSHTSFMSPLS